MAKITDAYMRDMLKYDEDGAEELNALARLFYKQHGYEAPAGFRFDQSRHPQEQLMFQLAVIACNYSREYGL